MFSDDMEIIRPEIHKINQENDEPINTPIADRPGRTAVLLFR